MLREPLGRAQARSGAFRNQTKPRGVTPAESVDVSSSNSSGGHSMSQQTTTFREMFWHVRDGGIYICEDLHTSYWPEWGGEEGGCTHIPHPQRSCLFRRCSACLLLSGGRGWGDGIDGGCCITAGGDTLMAWRPWFLRPT